MKPRHYLTEQDIEKIQHLIEVDRLQQWKVADAIGVHVGTIEKVCKRLGLKTVKCGSRTGSESAHWRGGRVKLKGYWHVRCPSHPHARKSGYVAEHRLVMETKLGRYLLPTEVVHHIDGRPESNSPENLMVFGSNATLGNTNGRRAKRGGDQPPQSIDRPTTESDSTGEGHPAS
jgi:hypothetical protein